MAPKARPKTREPRVTHQPFGIDKLPEEVHEAIRTLRSKAGLTWARIEARSARPYSGKWEKDGGGFVDWENLDLTLLEIFPNLRIPASNLHRWFYASVLQARNEVQEDGDAAQAFVKKLGELKIPGMNDAVQNAMTRTVFSLISDTSTANKVGMLEALNNASLVLTRLQRVQLQQQKAASEIAKSEADKARYEAEAGNPREIYLLAAQDILKKLNTRKDLRAVLEPIKPELVNEIAHGAEAFAKQVSAATA